MTEEMIKDSVLPGLCLRRFLSFPVLVTCKATVFIPVNGSIIFPWPATKAGPSVVLVGLDDLISCVHDEGAMTRNGLADRTRLQHQ